MISHIFSQKFFPKHFRGSFRIIPHIFRGFFPIPKTRPEKHLRGKKRLSEKLLSYGPLQGDDDAETEPELVELAVAGGLQMRKAWTIGLQEASLLHRNRALQEMKGGKMVEKW